MTERINQEHPLSQLVFQGTWRSYQTRVLNQLESYLADKKFHLVAAPGSGKTTIGIEVVARVHQPALILVPSLTIKSQWLQRIREAFLADDESFNQLVSADLQEPKWLTVATYQALHAAMKQDKTGRMSSAKGRSDLLTFFKQLPLGTLCLDECHHLKSAWWQSLEEFSSCFSELTTISLTATPPYEASGQEWRRYQAMCGEVDEEISVPELVKEGSLCPHQDYVAFSYLTAEEADQYGQIEAARERLYQALLADKAFDAAVLSHRYLQGQMTEAELFQSPDHLLSWLSYLVAKGHSLPAQLCHLTQNPSMPTLSPDWLGTLLQSLLFDYPDVYEVEPSYRKQLEAQIRAAGLINRRQVTLGDASDLLACLEGSVSKLVSIQQIVADEFASLEHDLRLLILTDHIHQDYVAHIGWLDAEVKAIGVLPIFEHLRRWIDRTLTPLSLAILCGSLVVIPRSAQQLLMTELEGRQLLFAPLATLDDYLVVEAPGREQELTLAMTALFEAGAFQVLIGTKAFLGEGWDAPCVNSLILASTVGSFMLSNQMRGRAIRTWAKEPDKTSNIWHLVTLAPGQDQQFDLSLLERRFQQFMGLSYDGLSIENGLKRLGITPQQLRQKDLAALEFETSIRAMDRSALRAAWQAALVSHQNLEVVHRQELPSNQLHFGVKLAKLPVQQVLPLPLVAFVISFLLGWSPLGQMGILGVVMGVFGSWVAVHQRRHNHPKNKLMLLAQALLTSLQTKQAQGFLEASIQIEEGQEAYQISLGQASYREKELFAQVLNDFFAGIGSPRYLIRTVGRGNSIAYYPVPAFFAANKKDAQLFFKNLEPIFKNSQLIYTKNPQGQPFLLEAQAKSLFENHSLVQVKAVRSLDEKRSVNP